ncbi:MAG: TM1266 family iron-only hydrogenase system putative regulator [Candidatus Borkfalkiaceae bacterium]|nr:TM1266 family iron-only hydrogenase system putative regulator [Christensenellaceae bacterium]
MRIAVIGIVIEKDRKASVTVNEILSEYGNYVTGRIGVPDFQNEIFVISVIVRAPIEVISAMTGKLGRLNGVTVKAAVTNVEIGDEEPRKE